jgi:orotidine-5'-phosphate decarboxylase
MYERLGVAGIRTYIDTVRYAQSKGMFVIGDVKRGDIGNTAEQYAKAHLGADTIGDSTLTFRAFDTEFITVNPYLGKDSIDPMLVACENNNRGIFILVKTSNPGSVDFQDEELASGKKLYECVGEAVEQWGSHLRGEFGFSSVGAVVGATHPEQLVKLRKLMPNTFFLIPGYGAQGGKAEDVARCFVEKGGCYSGGIVNSSRGIINAHNTSKYAGMEFSLAVRQAALDMRDDLLKHIPL